MAPERTSSAAAAAPPDKPVASPAPNATNSGQPYKVWAMDVTRPYEFIGFGARNRTTKLYEFIGFGAMDVGKPP